MRGSQLNIRSLRKISKPQKSALVVLRFGIGIDIEASCHLTLLPPNQSPIVKKIRDRKTRNCPEAQAAAAADRHPMKSRIWI